jgi:glycosyltransferase involved in cell wall biosynthesis
MKTVLLVANSLEGFGGVEARSIELVRELRDRGYRVVYLVCRAGGKYVSLFEDAGAVVIYLKMFFWWRNFPIPCFSGCFSGIKLTRSLKPTVILGLQPGAHYYARLLKLLAKRGTRVFAMERSEYSKRNILLVILDILLARSTEKYICVSNALRREMMSRTRILSQTKIVVIEDGAEAIDCSPDQELSKKLFGKFVIGCVSRLEAGKRQLLLVEMMKSHRDQHPNWCLVLVGDALNDPGVVQFVTENHMEEQVIVLGHRDDVHSIYPLFDVFAFPSIKEGFGCVWAEAMAHGVPVVSSDIAPMNEYIVHGHTGILFPADSAEALYCAIRSLYLDSDLRSKLGQNEKFYVNENLGVDKQRAKLIETLGL